MAHSLRGQGAAAIDVGPDASQQLLRARLGATELSLGGRLVRLRVRARAGRWRCPGCRHIGGPGLAVAGQGIRAMAGDQGAVRGGGARRGGCVRGEICRHRGRGVCGVCDLHWRPGWVVRGACGTSLFRSQLAQQLLVPPQRIQVGGPGSRCRVRQTTSACQLSSRHVIRRHIVAQSLQLTLECVAGGLGIGRTLGCECRHRLLRVRVAGRVAHVCGGLHGVRTQGLLAAQIVLQAADLVLQIARSLAVAAVCALVAELLLGALDERSQLRVLRLHIGQLPLRSDDALFCHVLALHCLGNAAFLLLLGRSGVGELLLKVEHPRSELAAGVHLSLPQPPTLVCPLLVLCGTRLQRSKLLTQPRVLRCQLGQQTLCRAALALDAAKAALKQCALHLLAVQLAV
eukprot:m.255733 g.255733  ORF g.255733 m.255733 type:complete len:401 (-) comp19687_c0_seq1:5111-6313(-)